MSFERDGWANNIILNPFQTMGTQFQGYITACSWGGERIDIFGSDASGQLLHFYSIGVGPNSSDVENLGKQGLTGQMTACSWGRNRIDIFGLNVTRDQMIQYYYDGKWEGPVSSNYEQNSARMVGLRPFVGNITCASWGPNRIDIFGQDSSGVVEQVYYDGGWAYGWGSVFHTATTSPTNAVISACAPDNGSVDTSGRTVMATSSIIITMGHGGHRRRLITRFRAETGRCKPRVLGATVELTSLVWIRPMTGSMSPTVGFRKTFPFPKWFGRPICNLSSC